jgi:hypothetical protein
MGDPLILYKNLPLILAEGPGRSHALRTEARLLRSSGLACGNDQNL